MRTASNPALPPFPTHGGGNLGPNLPGPYPALPASLSFTPVADDFPVGPPAMPQDAEMLKNIDILSSFVVKNGPDFEQLARKKQSADPKFAFLFEGEPDTNAAIGQRYYEWKKHALEASLWSQGGNSLCSRRGSIQDEVKLTSDALASPVGSDMEMEGNPNDVSMCIMCSL
jgi:hypothetical protein